MMATTPYRLPEAAGKLGAMLPAYPGSVLFVAGLNALLRTHFPEDVLDRLQGRTLRIQVRDAGVKFDFTWEGGAFRAARHPGEVDLVIGASLYDFFLLVQRREDPDTLFFARRLTLEGDTELGLMVKNTLDALDPSVVFDLSGRMPFRLLRSRKTMM